MILTWQKYIVEQKKSLDYIILSKQYPFNQSYIGLCKCYIQMY